MPTTQAPSVEQLKRAVEIAEQIERLQAELASLIGSQAFTPAAGAPASTGAKSAAAAKPAAAASSGKRQMSPEARERIAEAARRRWAKERSQKGGGSAGSAQKSKAGGRTLSPEAREKIAEAARRRWAKERAEKAGK